MDRDALIVQVRGMIAQNPVDVTFTPTGGTAQTIEGGEANITISERQLNVGAQVSYLRFVWCIVDDWTTAPAKRDVLTVDGTEYRILDIKRYYMGAAVRYDLGAKYEMRRD